MSTASHDSGTDIPLGRAPLGDSVGDGGGQPAAGAIWLDGDVLACSCPECGAPMSIRLWLMVADCFRCGTGIELTEEQEKEAIRLLRGQEEVKRTESREAAAAISPTMLRKPKAQPPPPVSQPAPALATAPAGEARRRSHRVAASRVRRGARARIRDLYEKGGIAVFWRGLFKDLPAWLVSLMLHLVAILLLGIWYVEPPEDSRAITLATSVSPDDLAGEQGELEALVEAFEFEDPGAIELNSVLEQAGAPNEDAADPELLDVPLEVPDPVGNLPGSVASSMIPVPPVPVGRMFAGRDPQVRAQVVRRAGGTSDTEAAVARGLKFLARHQNEDGSWSLHAFHRTPDCDYTCTGAGQLHSDVAATALSLLPFLGAGQTHQKGEYSDEVFRGLNWLVRRQKDDGDLCDGGQMYAHGQAAIALSEAYALSRDQQLREPAQRALDFIVRAQHPAGGWRYRPGESGDTSVVGWELMALKSGQMAYLLVPRKTFELTGLFLDHVQTDRYGGQYTYRPRGSPTPAMTAEALLCRQYLGWPKNHPGLQTGVDYLLDRHLPDRRKPNIYYWYYATQVMHHFGGEPWEKWNAKMRYLLVSIQEKRGHAAGSWAPRGRGTQGGFADGAGRIYMTSLAVCILEVYYRHMPIYSEAVLAGFE